MNIVVAGGGRVGFHLASLLCAENHNVTVIESDPERSEEIDYSLDASVLLGSTTSIRTLSQAGIEAADLFVAATGNDDINMLAAATAKALGVPQTVARADDPIYAESRSRYESLLKIDFILSPEGLAALDILQYLQNPGIVAAEDFGRGRVLMRQMRITRTPAGQENQLREICPPGCGALLAVISRGNEIIIPQGDTIVRPGDIVTLIGRVAVLDSFRETFRGTEPETRDVVIMGGGSIGLLLARSLEDRRGSVKIFERKPARCEELANILTQAKVVCRDAALRLSLEQEHVDDADVFVASTNDDERNIMAAMLAKEVGIRQTIAVLHQPDFAPLANKLGIDYAVTPRACIANRVLKLTHQKEVASLAVLEEGRVEIVEFLVKNTSAIAEVQLKNFKNLLSRHAQALVATIIRGDEVIVPSGEDQILAGDSVIVVTASSSIDSVRKLFTAE